MLAAVGFGAAAATVADRLAAQPRVAALRDRVERALLSAGEVSPSLRGDLRVATVSHGAVPGCDGPEPVASVGLAGGRWGLGRGVRGKSGPSRLSCSA